MAGPVSVTGTGAGTGHQMGLAKNEAVLKRIAGIENELTRPCDKRGATDFRDHCLIGPKPYLLNSGYRHECPQNALDRNRRAQFQVPTGAVKRRPCANS